MGWTRRKSACREARGTATSKRCTPTASAYMTGKSEAYYILEEIIHYKYKQADYDKFEMRLYDLSSRPQRLHRRGWVRRFP